MEIIVLHPYKKTLHLDNSLTLGELLEMLEIPFEDVLVMRNREGLLQDIDVKLEKEDHIQILPLLSGG